MGARTRGLALSSRNPPFPNPTPRLPTAWAGVSAFISPALHSRTPAPHPVPAQPPGPDPSGCNDPAALRPRPHRVTPLSGPTPAPPRGPAPGPQLSPTTLSDLLLCPRAPTFRSSRGASTRSRQLRSTTCTAPSALRDSNTTSLPRKTGICGQVGKRFS